MDMIELIGMLAGVLTTVAFVPQVIKTFRTGSARDFSLPMLVMFVSGLILWLVYGVLHGSAGLIGANAATLLLASPILAIKILRG